MPDETLLALTADIVSAHVSNNNVSANEVPALIQNVHTALSGLGAPGQEAAPEKRAPAVSVRSSVKPDYVVCLEDGKKLKMLKRYLRTRFDLSPDEYRAKWGLPKDYPMVAPNYAEMRSTLAVSAGLGRKKVEAAPTSKRGHPKAAAASKRGRGRPKAAAAQ